MQDEGWQWSRQLRINRGLTLNKYALIVLALSSIMLVVAISLDPKRTSIEEIADSELESLFAPAAGGEAQKGASQGAEKFSLKRKMGMK